MFDECIQIRACVLLVAFPTCLFYIHGESQQHSTAQHSTSTTTRTSPFIVPIQNKSKLRHKSSPQTTNPHSTLRLLSSRCSETKFLDSAEISLPRREGQGHDTANVHLGPVNVHVELQLVANGFDVLETLLIVGAGATDPDLDVVFDEDRGDFSDGADDALERGGDLFWE